MAKANYNATLEYATNRLEFWLTDDDGGAIAFPADTNFYIERLDNVNAAMSFNEVARNDANGHIVFDVTPTESTLYVEGDTVYDYENVTFEHMYSVRAPGVDVFLSGLLNLVRVA